MKDNDFLLKPNHFPIAERPANQVINLPLYPGLTPSQVETVTTKIHDFFKTL